MPLSFGDVETDRISAQRIGLKSEIDEAAIEDVLKNQNTFLWWIGTGKDTPINSVTTLDEDLFSDLIPRLNVIKRKTKPEDAGKAVIFADDEFRLQTSTYVDDDNSKLTEAVRTAVTNLSEELNLEDTACCEKLIDDENKQDAKAACDKANKILSTNIVLGDDKYKYPVDKKYIARWVSVDDKFNVSIDKNAIDEYVKQWNTKGSTRQFLTSHGKYVSVEGGDYGWSSDTTGVADKIYTAATECTDSVINIKTTQWALCTGDNDIGNSYVEVDLTNQYLYLYIDGVIKLKTPCVTGLPTQAKYTPQGTYRIKTVNRNAVLVGPGYRCPVSYWIPFNGGIGLHDATWQYKFGGDWYKVHGSHGCVNLPLNAAGMVYNEVFEGMPVVCYYYDRLPEFEAKPAEGNVISLNPGVNSSEYKDHRKGHGSIQGNLENKALADKKTS
jgi:lipoprotein-anchoring transpeptidase ErfK/SrfK